MISYKGFIGDVNFDSDARIFCGEVINTRTVITFQGQSVDEIEKEFRASIDDYLEWCKEDGVEPEKPYSGRFNIRITPELHKQAVINAKKRGLSLNKFIEKAVKDELKINV